MPARCAEGVAAAGASAQDVLSFLQPVLPLLGQLRLHPGKLRLALHRESDRQQLQQFCAQRASTSMAPVQLEAAPPLPAAAERTRPKQSTEPAAAASAAALADPVAAGTGRPKDPQQQQRSEQRLRREQQREHEAATAWLACGEGPTVNADCFICLEPLRRRKRAGSECVVTLACRHGFHAGCFMRYGGVVCPVCRRSAGPDEQEEALCCDDCDAKAVGTGGRGGGWSEQKGNKTKEE